MSVDARDERYEHVEIFGKPALFTNSRIDRDTVPEGWYCYDLRGSDNDPGRPISLENGVGVNHAGAILTNEQIAIPKEGYRRLRGKLNFLGEERSLSEFCEEYGLVYPEPSQYQMRAASEDEAALFFSQSVENTHPLSEYGLTKQGRRALQDAENPDLPHSYRWFVVEDFARDGELRHEAESLTGAIDRFNGLNCTEKRLCVTKDEVATVYLATTHEGETRLDEGWRDNPRFATDGIMEETAARLRLGIAGLEPSGSTIMMGGM